MAETYSDQNTGSSKTLGVTYSIQVGNLGLNYAVTSVPSTTGVITPAPLSFTAVTNTKTYDATTSAAVSPAVSGLFGTDTVTGLTESYSDANAGAGKTLTVNSKVTAVALTGLAAPDALAFDRSGNLFVADGNWDIVNELAPGATSPGATLTGVYFPEAMAFDPGGNLFVSGQDGTIGEFLPSGAPPVRTFSGPVFPLALAFDAGGNLYVANYFANTVSKCTRR